MSICVKCGKENYETSKFCISCGNGLKTTITSNKTKLVYGTVFIMLVAGIGAYFLFFNNFLKINKNIVAENESNAINNPDTIKIENTKDKPEHSKISGRRSIPKPIVPIMRAANVLPQWAESENISGDHGLIRLYIGAIGKKTIKLFIVSVDTVNNLVSGHSTVGNKTVLFEGPFTIQERKASTNQADNYVDGPESIYKLTLFEPESININGVFQLEIHLSDLFGGFGTGSWVSYDGKLYREISLDDIIAAQMK